MTFDKEPRIDDEQKAVGKLKDTVDSFHSQLGNTNAIFSKGENEMLDMGFTQAELDLLVENEWLEFDDGVTMAYSLTDKFYEGQ